MPAHKAACYSHVRASPWTGALGRALAVETAVCALRRALDHLRPGGHTQGEGRYSSATAAEATAHLQHPATTAAARQWWLRVAQWAAALIWLLSYDDSNCHRALRAAGHLLLSLASGDGASSLETGIMQTMAMG